MKKVFGAICAVVFWGLLSVTAQTVQQQPYEEPKTYYDLKKEAKQQERKKKRESKILKRNKKPQTSLVKQNRRESKKLAHRNDRLNHRKNKMIARQARQNKNNFGSNRNKNSKLKDLKATLFPESRKKQNSFSKGLF